VVRPLVCLCVLLGISAGVNANSIYLSSLDLTKMHQDWGQPRADLSVDKNPLTIDGQQFARGIGTHAGSVFFISLDGRARRFEARVGFDDEVKSAKRRPMNPVQFKVLGDRKVLFDSGPIRVGDAAVPIDADLTGVHTLVLVVRSAGPGINSMHTDWADAAISYTGDKPTAADLPPDPAIILTPQPGPAPQINCAKVVGVRPGHPLLFLVATSGKRPIAFSAEGLPAGLSIDADSGMITGTVASAGTYRAKLHAASPLGASERDVRIVVGDQIALTPPMGWNSWNCFARSVSDEKVRAAADAMVHSGLIQHGWTYINIDDCWEVQADQPPENRRDSTGRILTNEKFPDMKALTDYIHSRGLRAGIYSSPGPSTCGGFEASYNHEALDAGQYARWGFDYLKYDWCSYGRVADDIRKQPNPPSQLEILQHPYLLMRHQLDQQNRDIVFSLCQYGMGDVWKWGGQVGGNCWRTTDDINDSWGSMSSIGFNQNGHEAYAHPGNWNDPDMLVVGNVGWGPSLHPTRLSPSEQYTHITLWSLLSAPLLIGCDMTQLDAFTLNLLTNDEVIAVNQDPLGRQAKRISKTEEDTEVWARDLEDGSKAVGLFNRSEVTMVVTAKWSDLEITGPHRVRDLWRQKSLGQSDGRFSAEVPRHGAMLIKISPPGA